MTKTLSALRRQQQMLSDFKAAARSGADFMIALSEAAGRAVLPSENMLDVLAEIDQKHRDSA